MILFKNLSVIICVLLITNTVIYAPSGSDEGNSKEKEESGLSEGESDEKDLGTVSPTVMEELEKKIIEYQEENAEKFQLGLTNSPEDIELSLKEEEKEVGKELPEKVEEELEKKGDVPDFINFIELFNKINDEASDNENEEEIEQKSPEEMKKMKEETFELINKWYEKIELPEVSREEFDKVWKEREEKYGKKFPREMELVLIKLRDAAKKEESLASEVAEDVTEVSTDVAEISEEEVPKEAFILRNAKEKICILAKFHAEITITYPGETSEQKFEVNVPHHAHVKGKCGGSNRSPHLQVSWETFVLSFFFDKTSEDSWGVTSIELNYDTSEPLFDRAANRGKVAAKSKEANFFETPLGNSYFCPAQEVILYSEDQQVATLQIKELHLQPYDIKDGKFSTSHHCSQEFDELEDSFVQDETIPLAVGCTLALITLLILVGFSIHRAYQAAKVDYNEMP